MRVNRLDLNLLIALDTILTERSVTRAADRLFLTQGAASNALRRLRETFEDPLLVSSGREMVPTAFALEIAAEVKEIVNRAYRLSSMRARFDPLTSNRHFVIMLSDYSASMLMGELVRRLAVEAPGTTLELLALSNDLPASLDRGEADLIVVPSVEGMATYPNDALFSDEAVCVAWSGNTQIGETLTIENFFTAEHVLFKPPFPVDPRPALQLENATKVAVYSPMYMMLPALIAGTNRIAVMSRRFAERRAKAFSLRIFPMPAASWAIEEMMFWHPTRGEDAARQWLRTALRSIGEHISETNDPHLEHALEAASDVEIDSAKRSPAARAKKS